MATLKGILVVQGLICGSLIPVMTIGRFGEVVYLLVDLGSTEQLEGTPGAGPDYLHTAKGFHTFCESHTSLGVGRISSN